MFELQLFSNNSFTQQNFKTATYFFIPLAQLEEVFCGFVR